MRGCFFFIELTGSLVEQDKWRFYVAFDANCEGGSWENDS